MLPPCRAENSDSGNMDCPSEMLPGLGGLGGVGGGWRESGGWGGGPSSSAVCRRQILESALAAFPQQRKWGRAPIKMSHPKPCSLPDKIVTLKPQVALRFVGPFIAFVSDRRNGKGVALSRAGKMFESRRSFRIGSGLSVLFSRVEWMNRPTQPHLCRCLAQAIWN